MSYVCTHPDDRLVYDLTTGNHHFAAGVGRLVVHNTDSVFVTFPDIAKSLRGHDAMVEAIRRARVASAAFKPLLKPPHDLEFDKCLFPLVLVSKKRYAGMLYESEHDPGKLKSMGLVLKRRDNAPIVKRVYGGILDIILRQRDVAAAALFLSGCLRDMVEGRIQLEELVVSKSLRAYYKDPTRIAHNVLAQRMGERDPGNKPQPGDRLPYVYIDVTRQMLAAHGVKDASELLQGHRIEHPDYVRAKGLLPDVKHYIDHQIKKPVLQVFELALEQLPGFVPSSETHRVHGMAALVAAKGGDAKKAKERLTTLREREVEKLLFTPVMAHEVFRLRNNARKGQREITSFFASRKPC